MRKTPFARGGSPTVLQSLTIVDCLVCFPRGGGGYDPRLRHEQYNMSVLQNIYDITDRNYIVNSGFVKLEKG
jgi:hypothetical protein